jgi:hypothetical protein
MSAVSATITATVIHVARKTTKPVRTRTVPFVTGDAGWEPASTTTRAGAMENTRAGASRR